MPAEWTWRAVVLVALGGALGCVLRYFAGVWLSRGGFPWGTVAVNLAGSFAIGVVMFAAIQRGTFGPEARVFLVTGILGGFTTMSSFAYETSAFVDDSEWARAAGYATLNVVGSLGAAFLGRATVTAMAG
ncbi:MAG TPA: fluoride efflux transporter CrcB [Candidatus Thermoplasmatota archaeon]|nr:fluoride efflux transporter CrcB [Candidatus Thermoplasmatota archaeon]